MTNPPPIQREPMVILKLAGQSASEPMTLAEARNLILNGSTPGDKPAMKLGSNDWQPLLSLIQAQATQETASSGATPYPWQRNPQPGRIGAMDLVAPVRADPWAVLAGYLGLFSVILIAAPFSLAVAILALKSLKRNPERTGKGRAWFGLMMGVIGTPVLIWVVLSLLTRS